MSDFFTPVPLDFDEAFRNAELSLPAYALGCHLAADSFRVTNLHAGIITFHVASYAELCEASTQTVRNWLDELREKSWVDFEVKQGQRGPRRITLTGLYCKATSKPTSKSEGLLSLKSTSKHPAPADGGNALAENDSASLQLQSLARVRENETKRNETNREKPLQ